MIKPETNCLLSFFYRLKSTVMSDYGGTLALIKKNVTLPFVDLLTQRGLINHQKLG